MEIRLIEEVAYLIGKLRRAGYGAWAVGGCVRDAVLGRHIHDWDVCTQATPEQMHVALEGERLISTGLKHGTLTVVINGVPIETTTLRADGKYIDHRRPKSVLFVDDLALDLSRRDFTINAMAYSDSDGLTDMFGGLGDISARAIKCVGDPNERFNEDALRILRALRFASQLDFTIDPATARAAYEKRCDLNYISRERVYAEMVRLLEGRATSRVVRDNAEIICTALGVDSIDLSWDELPNDASLALAPLLGKDCVRALKSLKADNATLTRLSNLSAIMDKPIPHNERQALKLLRDAASDEAALDLTVYWRCRGVPFDMSLINSAMAKCHRISDLAIDGSDLAALGYQGRAIGSELEALLTDVIEGRLENDRAALIDKATNVIDISRDM